jgi:hypothetical protein
MPANPSWTRWTHASVGDHFDSLKGAYPLFIEGQHRDTDEDKNFFELRVDGPRLTETSKDCWKLRIEVNILIQTVMNETDYHLHQDMIGQMQAAFTSIPCFRYGNRPGDDDAQIGCYILQQNKANQDFIEANQFGQIDIRTKLLQATVEGHYVMDLAL